MTALHCGSTTIILVFFYTSRHPSIGRFSRVVESNSSPNSCNYVKIKHQNKKMSTQTSVYQLTFISE